MEDQKFKFEKAQYIENQQKNIILTQWNYPLDVKHNAMKILGFIG